MKHSSEYEAFTNLVDHLMTVTPEAMRRREAAYKKQSDANPRKRGPKRKAVKPPSVPHVPGA